MKRSEMEEGGVVRVPACEESRAPQFPFEHRTGETGRYRRDRSESASGMNWMIDRSGSCRCKGLCTLDRGDSWSWYPAVRRETGVFCGVTKNRKTKRAQHHAGIYVELRDFFEATLNLCMTYRIILNSTNL